VTELAEKRARLLALLDAYDLDAIVLRRPGNVAWYSGGGRTHILAAQDVGVADVVVARGGDEVVTAVNEAPRLRAEELHGLEAEWRVLPWSSEREPALPSGERVGCDAPLAGTRDVGAAIEAARRSLVPAELERYRVLGADAAAALTRVAVASDASWSEHHAAAHLAKELVERAVDPVVLLVAGFERLPHHRHPLPRDAALGSLAMFVVCARRCGLIASVTRFVSFGPLPAHLRDAYERLLRVDVAFNRATVAGARVGDVFAAGAEAYAENGFDAKEWQLHHQGGPTGYEPRDYLATPESEPAVEQGQAFAWNPSVPSLKSEDTIVAGSEPPEVLTVDPEWPIVEVGGLARPLVLER